MRIAKLVLLIPAITLITSNGYSQSSLAAVDTSFKDVTNEYLITLPTIAEFVQWDYATIWGFAVAVTPLELIDKKAIDWKRDTGGAEALHHSELKFQEEMFKCTEGYFLVIDGRYPGDSAKSETKKGTSYCQKNYCRRTEYSGYNMGTSYFTNYVGFEKDKCFILFKFNSVERNCLHGLSEPGKHELIMQCERDKRRSRIVIDAFINKVVNEISFIKSSNK